MSKASEEFFKRELHLLENEAEKSDNAYYKEHNEYPNPTALSLQKKVTHNVMQLHSLFDGQQHDNMSAGYTIEVFNKLVHFTPLTHLTGNEDEWKQLKDNIEYNIRFPTVTRTDKDNSTAIIHDGIIFCEPDSTDFITDETYSVVKVEFPFIHFERKLIQLNHKIKDKSIGEQLETHDYKELN